MESGGSYNLGLLICSFSGQRKQSRLHSLQGGPKALVFLWPGGERGSTAHLQHTWTLMNWSIMREQHSVHFQIILTKSPCWALLFMVWKLADSDLGTGFGAWRADLHLERLQCVPLCSVPPFVVWCGCVRAPSAVISHISTSQPHQSVNYSPLH